MARHQLTIHLSGGQTEVIDVSEVEVGLTEEGNVGSYTIKSSPEEEISYLYFRPDSIVGIKAVLLEAEEPVED